MRMPRWLVVLLLGASLGMTLGSAGWWWLTWPERTAGRFVDLVANGRMQEIQQSLPPPESGWPTIGFKWVMHDDWQQSRLHAEPRSFVDVLTARQRFTVDRMRMLDGMGDYKLTVARGRVVEHIIVSGWSSGDESIFVPYEKTAD